MYRVLILKDKKISRDLLYDNMRIVNNNVLYT